MGFFIRKSIKLGPVRLNLSKSGIGTSVGVKGFRVGVRPNGSSYVHAGRHGLYYREELGNINSSSSSSTDEYIDDEIEDPYTTYFKNASSDKIGVGDRKELIEDLTFSRNAFRYDNLYMVILCIILILFGYGILHSQIYQSTPHTILYSALFILALVPGVFSVFKLNDWEVKRRTITIDYDFEDGDTSHYEQVLNMFNTLAENRAIWEKHSSKRIYDSTEAKRNAGASSLITRTRISVGESKPPWVETNVNVPIIHLGNQQLYMMPDGILVYDNKGIGFVNYNDISIDTDTSIYIEDERVPSDAKVIDHTWQHPNRDGGPDRRFANNHEIPICLYGVLQLESTSGLFINLMTSKTDTPDKFNVYFKNLTDKAIS